MGKVYLRKQRTPKGICSGCYFMEEKSVVNCAIIYKCSIPHDVVLKKISEKHAKKLLKSGKCKIVQQ